jgi:hypothetical protein
VRGRWNTSCGHSVCDLFEELVRKVNIVFDLSHLGNSGTIKDNTDLKPPALAVHEQAAVFVHDFEPNHAGINAGVRNQ